ncbi:thioesterase II family protein [Bacillus thuringiensis]|uniref:thioesterase II family protein n=1 Tax=Bacillus cereus group TaxID=86661 RepID=UPI0001A1C75E|nr:thioesterase domain-containing protein [Bacillus thuringiensis]MCU4825160.1 thioesterase domain-containing protein [Bacillus cereus]EEM85527.1 Thioesterase II-like protein [Bacillus thuringiensis serovar huazhongensis BGSC 4BD1]MCU4858012.1 thioesterase domain-containing protein [Bacillus cereus]MCU4874784.1 thioesterase domain-containing protein [Bacillus cereus]MCU4943096.1 thioesterase domain-containing protein [Bacillus cereus]
MKTLFCLPYAGGSSSIYYKWNKYIGDSLELYPIELKGRGARINEAFYEDINEAVDDIYDLIKDKISEGEYALFGHSMGGRLAYKLYHKIEQMKNKKPKHIFFSACGVPSIKKKTGMIHTLPDDVFLKEIMRLGGTSEELLYNKDLRDLYIPIIRNDFRILEKDKEVKKSNKIDCDITVLSGDEDNTISTEATRLWANYTNGECKIIRFKGDHFFINHHGLEITEIIKKMLH